MPEQKKQRVIWIIVGSDFERLATWDEKIKAFNKCLQNINWSGKIKNNCMNKHKKKLDEYEEKKHYCRKCKKELHGRNAIEVGYCLECFHEMMADDGEEETN